MGKSYSNWFSRLLRRKKPPRHQLSPPSFVDELGGGSDYSSINYVDVDPEKHAIAVAAATAAVAQAALAAAKAAAEVVRMTKGRRKNLDEFAAAVKIQSAFRGYLARRALRALKGLVKLQALVRGHFVRKRSAEMLRRMQAMFRVQARAVASRTTVQSTLDHPNNNSTTDATSTPPAFMRRRSTETQHQARCRRLNEASIFKRCGSVSSARDMRSSSFDRLNQRTQRQEQDNWLMEFDCASHSSMRMARQAEQQQEEDDQILNDKILEIDSSWRPDNTYNHHYHRRKYYSSMSLSHLKLDHHHQKKPSSNYAVSPCDLDSDDVVSLRSLQFFPIESNHYYMGSPQQPYSSRTGTGTGSSLRGRKSAGRTTYNSKEAFSGPSMRNQYESAELLGLGSRTRGFVGPDCYISNIGYFHPNYMANTESSRAKVRSQSAPKQRLPELSPERVVSMTNRSINYDCSDFKASSRGGSINSSYA